MRLSNLMAFDATAYGNWGCDPALYPEALRAGARRPGARFAGWCARSRSPRRPQMLEAVHQHAFAERVVLVP